MLSSAKSDGSATLPNSSNVMSDFFIFVFILYLVNLGGDNFPKDRIRAFGNIVDCLVRIF
jgi:hypothetical protein